MKRKKDLKKVKMSVLLENILDVHCLETVITKCAYVSNFRIGPRNIMRMTIDAPKGYEREYLVDTNLMKSSYGDFSDPNYLVGREIIAIYVSNRIIALTKDKFQ